jgi:hypothetical protein
MTTCTCRPPFGNPSCPEHGLAANAERDRRRDRGELATWLPNAGRVYIRDRDYSAPTWAKAKAIAARKGCAEIEDARGTMREQLA